MSTGPHRWQPGQSGNPSGARPKAVQGASARLSRAIDAATLDGKALHEALLELVFGRCAKHPDTVRCPDGCTVVRTGRIDATSPQWARLRLEALGMLLDRWAGKPQQTIEVQTGETAEDEAAATVRSLSPDRLAALLAVLEDEPAPPGSAVQ